MKNESRRIARLVALAGMLAVGGCDETAGEQGPAGTNGTNGTNGTDGTNGTPGTNGTNGTPGTNGTNGTDGEDGEDGTSSGRSIFFTPVDAPATDAAKRLVDGSPSALVNDEEVALGGYHTILRSGQVLGANTFGVLVRDNGSPLLDGANAPVVADSSDFTSLLAVGARTFSVTHFESSPGAMYYSELTQAADGTLTATSTAAVDFSAQHGLWTPCAGSVTPWGTHLGSEEYPPDARGFSEAAITTWGQYRMDARFSGDSGAVQAFVRYFGVTNWTDATTMATVRGAFNPYDYGYATEVTVTAPAAGAPTVTPKKHYAMGRAALELAYVMPDRRTVYYTDDGSYDGLYMFVADTAGDLSAGDLYAVRWTQTSDFAGGSANLSWISLGHATEAAVEALLTTDVTFADIFETGVVASCDTAGGYRVINAGGTGAECLRLRAGMEVAASRLETRRYAGYMGATTEFNKEEGITYDPTTHSLYLAISDITASMTSADATTANHIHLPANRCGAVYRLDVGIDWTIQSEFVARTAKAIVAGRETTYTAPSPFVGNTCDIDGIASPDNVSVLPGYDLLIIGEDTSRHQNDVIWAYDLRAKELTRIQTTPYGAETTSPYWHPNLRGHGYLVSVVQHPFGESDQTQLGMGGGVPGDARSYVGYIGPFPALD